MIPICMGMPVRFGSGAPWKVMGLHEETEGEYKGEFSGLIIIQRGTETLNVPYEAIKPVDGLLWFEEVGGGKPIVHFGLDDLQEELDDLPPEDRP